MAGAASTPAVELSMNRSTSSTPTLGLRALPASPASRQEPTTLSCLRCQLLGHRKLLCAKEDACRETRHVSAFGPILLVGWLATLVAFFVAVWR